MMTFHKTHLEKSPYSVKNLRGDFLSWKRYPLSIKKSPRRIKNDYTEHQIVSIIKYRVKTFINETLHENLKVSAEHKNK